METHEATLLHSFLWNHSVFCLKTSVSPSFLLLSTIHKQPQPQLTWLMMERSPAWVNSLDTRDTPGRVMALLYCSVLYCSVLYCTVLYTPNERVMALRLLITLSVSGHQRIWGPAHGRETVMMINMKNKKIL